MSQCENITTDETGSVFQVLLESWQLENAARVRYSVRENVFSNSKNVKSHVFLNFEKTYKYV